jgi:chaperone modulatory protein CbpM
MAEVTVTHVELLGGDDWLAITEICRLCSIDAGALQELAELGVVAPRGAAPAEWQFPATGLPRLRVAGRLMRDLGVNASGAALAVELLDVQRELEQRIRALERLTDRSSHPPR